MPLAVSRAPSFTVFLLPPPAKIFPERGFFKSMSFPLAADAFLLHFFLSSLSPLQPPVQRQRVLLVRG